MVTQCVERKPKAEQQTVPSKVTRSPFASKSNSQSRKSNHLQDVIEKLTVFTVMHSGAKLTVLRFATYFASNPSFRTSRASQSFGDYRKLCWLGRFKEFRCFLGQRQELLSQIRIFFYDKLFSFEVCLLVCDWPSDLDVGFESNHFLRSSIGGQKLTYRVSPRRDQWHPKRIMTTDRPSCK